MPILIFLIALLSAGDAEAWLARLSGTLPILSDVARASALAPDGSVVVTMLTEATPGTCTIGVRRIDAVSGEIRWRRTLAHVGCFSCRCHFDLTTTAIRASSAPVVVDGDDRVFVGTPGFGLTRLDGATGEVIWTRRLAQDGDDGSVNALAISAGDLIMAGAFVGNPMTEDADADFAVVKVDRETGAARWNLRLRGELPPCEEDCDTDAQPQDGATGVVVGDDEMIHVVGHLSTIDGTMFTLLALDGATGAERWRIRRPGYGSSVIRRAGSVYAAGTVRGKAAVLRARASDGRVRWLRRARGAAAFLAPVPNGDVVVAGQRPGPRRERRRTNTFVARLDGRTGRLRWRIVLDAGEFAVGEVHGLTTGAAGDVSLVTSTTSTNLEPEPTWSVHSLRRGSGRPRWSVRFGGQDGTEAVGLGVLRLPDGDVATIGGSRAPDAEFDAEVARLDRRDGRIRWRTLDEGTHQGDDFGRGVTIAGDGDVVVAGSVENGLGADFLVAKLDGTTGELRWQRELDGADPGRPSGHDGAADVAATPDGGVVAIGSMVSEDKGELSPAVVKLDASGEVVWQERFRGCCRGVPGRGQAVRVRDDGDVAVLTSFDDGPSAVVMLDGHGGKERWRHLPRSGSVSPNGYDLLPGGDVVLVDDVFLTATDDPVVTRLAGDTGDVRWQTTLGGLDARALAASAGALFVGSTRLDDARGPAVVLRLHAEDGSASWRTPLTHPDASSGGVHIVRTKGEGDVVAAGHFRPASTDDPLAPSRPFVAMLEAPTGAIRWLSVLPAGETTNAWVSDVGLDDAGHVVATLALGSEQPFAVVAFDGSNGTERWRRVLAESSSYLAGANRLTIGPNGRVVAVGMGTWADTGRDATVWSIDGETGSD